MIEGNNLVKMYGNHLAVDDLSFTIEPGKIYGLLGPNGAGKSTTMNIITGCLAATSGTVSINGNDIFEDAVKAKKAIGYLPEIPPLYPDMTPLEYLDFIGEAKGLGKEERKKQIADIMERTKTADVQNTLIRHLSKGYKQRVGIAQAMIGYPEVIILDEPTVGLDPKQIIEIRDLIKSLKKDHTVILSSHILSEVSAVCDYIMIIAHGKLVASDTPENLTKLMAGTNTVSMTVKGSPEKVRELLSSFEEIQKLALDEKAEGLVSVSFETSADRDIREAIFYAFAEGKMPLLEMVSKTLSLEDIFIRLTDDSSDRKQKKPKKKTKEEVTEDESDL